MTQIVKLSRRTLKFITYYPPPSEIYERIMKAENGWNYKTDVDAYRSRDVALIAVVYLCALRISEALRLKRKQVVIERKRIRILGIALSKSRYAGKNRREQFRQEARISLTGERASIGKLLLTNAQAKTLD